MNDNDEQQASQVKNDSLDTPEGLGHDPLEWLQEDEEEAVADSAPAAQAKEEQKTQTTEVETEPAVEVEPEFTAEADSMPEQESEPQTAAPSDDASDNQSFTFDNHKAILTLPEKLTVQIIEPLHSEWKTLLYDLPQSLEIDASKVADVDAAGMQLFYALVQQMVFKGSDVVILNVEPSLQRHFELFGLDDFFSQHIHAA